MITPLIAVIVDKIRGVDFEEYIVTRYMIRCGGAEHAAGRAAGVVRSVSNAQI